jgi:hypothetical protein
MAAEQGPRRGQPGNRLVKEALYSTEVAQEHHFREVRRRLVVVICPKVMILKIPTKDGKDLRNELEKSIRLGPNLLLYYKKF